VGCERYDWQNKGAGCYPIGGSKHVVQERRWWKMILRMWCKSFSITLFPNHMVTKTSFITFFFTTWPLKTFLITSFPQPCARFLMDSAPLLWSANHVLYISLTTRNGVFMLTILVWLTLWKTFLAILIVQPLLSMYWITVLNCSFGLCPPSSCY
jgi:hypothetical protein